MQTTTTALTDAQLLANLRAENANLIAELERREATAFGVFTPFTWLHREAQDLPGGKTICRAQDIAQGAALALELAYDSELVAEGTDETPYLSVAQRGDLTRFAATAMKMLAEETARAIDQLNDLARGRAQRG